MSAVRCSPHSVVLSLSSRQGYATLELLLLDASSFPFPYVARTTNRGSSHAPTQLPLASMDKPVAPVRGGLSPISWYRFLYPLSRCFSPSVHQLLRRVDDLVPTLAHGLISFTACLRHPTCARRAHTSWRSAAYAEERHPRRIGGKDRAKNSRGAAPHSSLPRRGLMSDGAQPSPRGDGYHMNR